MTGNILIYVWIIVIGVHLDILVNSFDISVVHINDFHARFEETNEWGDECRSNEKCIGGFSRLYQTLASIKRNNPQVLLLNAGDNFQGTVWYSLYKGQVIHHFLNEIPFDAYTLGNHEFDDEVNETAQFLKNLRAPVVVSNVDDSQEPEMRGLYRKSLVLERKGRKIGIIGVLLKAAKEISRSGRLNFLDETESINREAQRLVKDHGVFTNIVLSHSGYTLEKEMAKKASNKISLIVGGHSHSLLWTGENPPSNAEKPEGPYPTVVHGKDGRTVLVVQAQSFARYVGNLTISFNEDGSVNHWSGQPIFLDSKLPQNDKINKELSHWKKQIEQKANRIVGETLTDLSNVDCVKKECTLGNFIADAFVFNELRFGDHHWTNASMALINCGSLKGTIYKGNITYQNILDASPFGNQIVVGSLRGRDIIEALEHALEHFGKWESRLLQVSGIKVTYDLKRPKGKQVVSAEARCSKCDIPTYSNIVQDQEYYVVLQQFISEGGDGFNMFKNKFKVKRISGKDTDLILKYISKKSPVLSEVDGRLRFIE